VVVENEITNEVEYSGGNCVLAEYATCRFAVARRGEGQGGKKENNDRREVHGRWSEM
jgi:hypothetical protein